MLPQTPVTTGKTLTPAQKANLTPAEKAVQRRQKTQQTLNSLPIIGVPLSMGYNLLTLKDQGVGRTAKSDLFQRFEGLMFPTKSGGSGVGVNFQHTGYTNKATATIGDGARVSSQRNVRVEATTHNLLLDLTAAGVRHRASWRSAARARRRTSTTRRSLGG